MRNKRDTFAGLFLLLMALAFGTVGSQYGLGTLRRMGPGFYPVMASVVLAALGLAVMLVSPGQDAEHDTPRFALSDLRASAAILVGFVAFALSLQTLGLVPATILLVLAAAAAENNVKLPKSIMLAALLATLSVVLFKKILGINVPIFRWPL